MDSTRFLLETINLNTVRLISLMEEINISRTEKDMELPEWLTLEQAVMIKGGGSLSTYKTRYVYQPCCGRNSKKIAGRKCWKKEDVLEWVQVTDDLLPEYAAKWGVSFPQNKELSS